MVSLALHNVQKEAGLMATAPQIEDCFLVRFDSFRVAMYRLRKANSVIVITSSSVRVIHLRKIHGISSDAASRPSVWVSLEILLEMVSSINVTLSYEPYHMPSVIVAITHSEGLRNV
jgi:hypothetical protein